VAKVARRATDELRDLVRVLELGAVNLDDGVRVSEENLGDPVGPRKSIVPTGRFGGFIPARKIW
jgi:hypothetical protein